jgi:formylglycine-generating enzyme required for sulfatase activity/energy-coupling factor transporter ATP-binding protein EcfA2
MTKKRNHYLTDHATDTDLLRYEDFQAALYDIVTQAETPLTIGVFGPWGSGKTSLMKMLHLQLEGESINSRRTVWFTAWKYDRHDALWRAFILRVLDALYPRENEPGDRPRSERPILQNPGPREARLIKLLNRLEESVYQPVDWEEIGPRAINWWQFISNTGKAGIETAATLSSGGLFIPIKKALGGDDTPIEDIQKAAAAIGRETKSYHRRQLRHMEEFEKTFQEAVGLLDPEGTGRLVVFVDDLDRCLPEKALEVLEAIKLFLEVAGVVFVLGMDQAVIRQGIEARYAAAFLQEMGERAELPIQGDSYLQKIVQIPFHLPALAVDDVAAFIEQLNPALSERTRAVLARGVYPNPRQVKRVLNILRLLRGVADRRFDAGVIADPLLAKTVIIQAQYPRLYQLWRQYPTLVQTLEAEYGRRPTSDEEMLTGIRRVAERPLAAPETAVETMLDAPAAAYTAGGGLLDEYLSNRARYALLARLMTYPPENEAGSGAERARFSGLTRPQVEVYVRLAGAVESDPVPVDAPADLMNEFLSGDAVKISDAAARLESQEAADGPIHQAARRQLVAILSDPQQPVRRRVSAGDALGQIGDPRFHDESGFYLPNDDLLGFVKIPAGPFRMGSDPQKDPVAEEHEQPQHTLELDTFYIARYPVTVAQFRLFVAQSGHKSADERSLAGIANHPARFINWFDAIAYCRWLTEKLHEWPKTPAALSLSEGWSVTLPSEAEWEKAARGTDARLYPWGDDFDSDRANFKDTGLKTTSAVGCFPGGTSAFGLLDMSGNVLEWTRTIWGEWDMQASNFRTTFRCPYSAADGREDLGKGNDWFRVLRGSSFSDVPALLRCSARGRLNPLNFFDDCLGFRGAVSRLPLNVDPSEL